MHFFSSDFKLGILGGGQLGKMLLYETQKWDMYTKVMDASAEAPCKTYCNAFVVGDLLDFDAVYAFGKKVDVLTLEIEHVNVAALERLEAEGIQVYPSAKTMRIIQNKAAQKLFYIDNNIPTAPFSRFAYTSQITDSVSNGGVQLPAVWKSTQFGYDGRGVKVIAKVEDVKDLPNVECIVEEQISVKKELAVIVARNTKGEVQTYPVVEMEFHPEANQVEYVLCPARIEDDVAQKAVAVALQVSERLQHVGLLAVELFQTHTNDILVNEVAPRPHNSGHYSIEASYTNQFQQHLRAILGLPLGNTESKVAGVMVNLVGAEGYTGPVVYENLGAVLGIKGVSPHLYGKKHTRPFRKMGHVTVVDAAMDRARNVAQQVKETVRVISQ